PAEMNFTRSSGILLHPTSLPGSFGIGDIGPAAQRFCDLLLEAGQTYWQILPLGPTGFGDSPYQAFSAFAGNPHLISPALLVPAGLLAESDLADAPAGDETRVDYGAVHHWKRPLLRKAFDNFKQVSDRFIEAAHAFIRENAFWLDDYALYQ